jgi:hypothetical protein
LALPQEPSSLGIEVAKWNVYFVLRLVMTEWANFNVNVVDDVVTHLFVGVLPKSEGCE